MNEKHTPEPWKLIKEHNEYVIIRADAILNERGYFDHKDEVMRPSERLELSDANANRIVACVNACAGMDDPAKDIAAIRRINTEMLGFLERLLNDCEEELNINGQVPLDMDELRTVIAAAGGNSASKKGDPQKRQFRARNPQKPKLSEVWIEAESPSKARRMAAKYFGIPRSVVALFERNDHTQDTQ